MKKYQVNPNSPSVLDAINYTSSTELKTLIKYLLTADAPIDDESKICLLADIKTLLGFYEGSTDLKILTSRQKTVIIEHLIKDRKQVDLAVSLNITQQGVSILLNSALNRIKNYILNGELNWIPWTDADREYLLSNYGKLTNFEISKKLGRPQGKVISMYHYLKNKEKC